MTWRRVVALAAAFGLLLLVLVVPAVARPGGGESYSGGGGGGGGGGGDGDGGFVFLLLRIWLEFCIAYPQIGIPVTLAVVAFLVIRHRKKLRAGPQSWTSTAPTAPPPRVSTVELDRIRELDPGFSEVLFEDFAYALFAKAHEARAQLRELEALAPYLSPAARGHLARRQPEGAPVTAVVVGALRVRGLSLPHHKEDTAALVAVVLEIEANMTVAAGTSQATHYVRERWRLVRAAGVQSRPPELARSFKCPSCGAPFASEGDDRCSYCGQVVSGGRFDWSVQAIDLLQLESRPPALTTTVEEVGTDWPTVFHPELAARWAELVRDDPAVTQHSLQARLELIYGELNAAWTARDLKTARPFVSDGLFDYLQFWIGAYREQGLRNVLEGMHILRWQATKVVRDQYFDSLTVRLWGTGLDYTVRKGTSDVVSGSRRAPRAYSEYWTLIRGAATRGAPRSDKGCPNCGAELTVSMAGLCEHCGAKITSGDFDWVLSKIEQDDSYSG
jgi:predicted lipid-binding transport protein (Tim44 family)